VVDGAAYRVTAEGSAGAPPGGDAGQTADATPAEFPAESATPTAHDAGATPGAEEPGGVSSQESVGFQVCGTALVLPLLALVGLGAGLSRRRRLDDSPDSSA